MEVRWRCMRALIEQLLRLLRIEVGTELPEGRPQLGRRDGAGAVLIELGEDLEVVHERGELEEVNLSVTVLIPRTQDHSNLGRARCEAQPAESLEKLLAIEVAALVDVERVELHARGP